MTSKEALENISWRYVNDPNFQEWCNIIKQDLERLEEVEEENKKLKNQILSLELDTCIPELRKENKKLKQAIEILKDKLDIKLEIYHNGGCTLNYKIISNCITSNDRCLRHLEVEQYELLKEVKGNENN